ncbi:MAG: hypothetical protein SNH63_01070 [Rikenellaceae bacterium]
MGYPTKSQSKREQSKITRFIDGLPEYSVTFYPEGGDMVMGLWSTVAFQVKDQNGEPIEVSGKIYDRKGVVADVRSTHLGIGLFDIVATMNQYYMVIDGDETQYELPQPLKTGCVLSVENLADSKSVEISISSAYSRAIGVAIISRGEVSFVKRVTKSRSLTIPKSNLCEGVNQIVLYDSNSGQELASRLIYVKNGSQPQLSIEAQRSGDSAPHARQELAFRVLNDEGEGVATNFSLSVCDDDGALGTASNNIYTSLLLSSEVRGYIPNANYYFEAEDEERARNLDLVMMVYGWSRYKWDDMTENTSSEMLFKYEKSLTLYGRVFKQYWDERYRENDSFGDYEYVKAFDMSSSYFNTRIIPFYEGRWVDVPSRNVEPYRSNCDESCICLR